MRVLVINPNSTASMTGGIVAAARAAAPPDLAIEGLTNAGAPPAIQGEADGRLAAPGVIAASAEARARGIAAVIIACFDDTALAEARAATALPVIGIGHAAFLAAALYGRFSVITTLQVSVPVIEANIAAYGMAGACAGVHASGLPVLSLEADPGRAAETLAKTARAAAKGDGASALVLGCAGMAPFGPAMYDASGLPAIDGVAAAVGLARTALIANRGR